MKQALAEAIEIARKREDNDDHLSDKQRERLVRAVEKNCARGTYEMSDYPYGASINDRYVHIICNM